MRREAALLAITAAACSARSSIVVQAPWPEDHTVVFVPADPRGVPLEPSPRVVSGSAVLELEAESGTLIRLFAAAFAPDVRSPDGRTISECGVAFGAGMSPLDPPDQVWVSPAFDPGEDGVSFEEAARDAIPFALGYERCGEPTSCDGYTAELIPAPPGLPTRCIVALDDETAIFGARSLDGTMRLGRVDRMEVTMLPGDPRLPGGCKELMWDGADALYAINHSDFGGQLYRLDLGGRYADGPLAANMDEISIGRGGPIILVDGEGFAFELSATSTVVRRPDFPVDIRNAVAVRRDRMFMRDRTAIYFNDGAAWTLEHGISIIESIAELAADDDVAVVTGELEVVRVRNEETHTWELLERPFDGGLRLRGAAGMGGGRFIVAGDSGAVAVWNTQRWCVLNYVVATQLAWVAVSPSKRVAYVTGDDDIDAQRPTPLIRVEIPPPP